MAAKPLVSIFCITYNHRPYIQQCLDSLLAQKTDFPFEIIVHDDASTDGTTEVIKEYELRYPEIVVPIYQKENQYSKGNRRIMASFMICVARGEYIAFCEGDDFWHRPDKLQLQIDHFRADDSLVCVSSGVRIVSPDGEVVDKLQHFGNDAKANDVEYRHLIYGIAGHPTCAVVARTCAVRRAYSGNSLCNDRSMPMGDLPLWLEMSQLGRMIHLPDVLASYRLSANSATRQSDPLWSMHFEMCALEIQYRALEKYPLPGDERQTSQAKLEFARRLLRGAARIGDCAVARCQWRRLTGLGSRATLSDVACMAFALTPLPRRSLAVTARKLSGYLKERGCKRNGFLGYLWHRLLAFFYMDFHSDPRP
jgi:hypothetical protein